jgi:biotin synthase
MGATQMPERQTSDHAAIALIDRALEGEELGYEQIEQLFALDAYSQGAYHLQWAAHRVAWRASEGKGLLYSQLGLDANPCAGNCDFCAFARSNNTKTWSDERTLSLDTILAYCRAFSAGGTHLISLMTTAGYNFERFCETVRLVKQAIDSRILLMANIGDFNFEQALALRDAGIDVVYHAVRIGEGQITALSPKQRYQTLTAAKLAGLLLMSGVEPIYVGQDSASVIRRMREVAGWDLICSGLGSLRSVHGTKMEDAQPPGAHRQAVLSALFRLLAGLRIPFGSENTRWCNGGTNPRDNHLFPPAETISASLRTLRRELESDGWHVPAPGEDWQVPTSDNPHVAGRIERTGLPGNGQHIPMPGNGWHVPAPGEDCRRQERGDVCHDPER